MDCGLIGFPLAQSFSPEIHRAIAAHTQPYSYELHPLAPQDLDSFMRSADFRGINVTIPHKRAVLAFLNDMSQAVAQTGTCNTIVRREGGLYGENTDISGLTMDIEHAGISLAGARVMILGTGGTAHTAAYVAHAAGARSVVFVSRTPERHQPVEQRSLSRQHSEQQVMLEGSAAQYLSYMQAEESGDEVDVLINATPCGMYPDVDDVPVDIDHFPHLTGVVDVIYSPLRSRLVLAAAERGIRVATGLRMLVGQAISAASLFLRTEISQDAARTITDTVWRSKANIVLIGMPGVGKTTQGHAIADALGRTCIDIDEEIEAREGMSVRSVFDRKGEAYFRQKEAELVAELSTRNGIVIACGGGTVLRHESVRRLKVNGKLFLLDRPLDTFVVSDTRPLADSRAKLAALEAERMPLYRSVADAVVEESAHPEDTTANFVKRWAGESAPC
ncbi:MAG: shikimate kinase [Actinomycetaceae bacterium]|nr:shikimate kinase [Actinomycetaceae bacterium]MDY6082791.1 shikimate kinase [Actinomycetaceae bacterium]